MKGDIIRTINKEGKILMKWNWVSSLGNKYTQGETYFYTGILEEEGTCKCNGYVNTFWLVNGDKMPMSRAVDIN